MARPVMPHRRAPRLRAEQAPWDAPVPRRGDPAALAALIGSGRTLVLSGAGLSTESGIPDYRGPTSARRRHAPMTYDAFVGDPTERHRYWARGFVGWPQIAHAQPNHGHRAVATLQRAGLLAGIVTQNVDGLHQAAGARDVTELHGALARVACLRCGAVAGRDLVQRRLRALNPGFEAKAGAAVKPDGDAELSEAMVADFVMTCCPTCGGGPLKPDVVYFGESVPKQRVRACFDLVAGARSVVVLGSSLTVMSGLRFVHAASRSRIPVAVVATGPSRADDLADVRLDTSLSDVLTEVLATLGLA